MIQSDRGNPDHQKARHSRTELARSQKQEPSRGKTQWSERDVEQTEN